MNHPRVYDAGPWLEAEAPRRVEVQAAAQRRTDARPPVGVQAAVRGEDAMDPSFVVLVAWRRHDGRTA